jgi:hypothetical protein
MLSVRQMIELFHLVFLRALVAKGEDKGLIALKGGCNLRFYFGSVRYSEDIDLDVAVIAEHKLKNKVDRILTAPTVTAPLRTQGIEIAETAAPKQTPTTQRWRVMLRAAALGTPLPTKIEFSRRLEDDAIVGAAFEATGRDVMRPYGLPQFLAMHYTTHAAIQQKIDALAGRREPQARDVFDLHLLLARPEAAAVKLDERHQPLVAAAVDRSMSISFDDYTSKVVAYLDPEHAELYEGRPAWDQMQETVVSRLDEMR